VRRAEEGKFASLGCCSRFTVPAVRAIGAICDKLGLVRVIKDRACELYKKVRHRIVLIIQPPRAAARHNGVETVKLTGVRDW